MVEPILINDLLTTYKNIPVIDVRSEGEYAAGHILGAENLPVLNNDERAKVGTCFKTKGNKEAILLGYQLVGHKFVEYLKHFFKNYPDKTIVVYCWRGGLRSKIMANLLSSAGYNVLQLKGGYKSFRNYSIEVFKLPYNFKILGGFTGCNKTEILELLKNRGEQVINLEKIANHRGSAFGSLGLGEQPTQEQFENNLAQQLLQLNISKPIWIEDESRTIGNKVIPWPIFEKMRGNKLYFLNYSKELRANNILLKYGSFNPQELINGTKKLEKKLGNLRTNMAIEFIQTNQLLNWIDEVLNYYDKMYLLGLQKRNPELVEEILWQGDELLNYLLDN